MPLLVHDRRKGSHLDDYPDCTVADVAVRVREVLH